MSNNYPQYTRFNADHTRRIEIDYQWERDETAQEDAKWLGLEVLTGNENLADAFGVEVNDNLVDMLHRKLDAIRRGDHVFYLEYGCHSARWFHFRTQYPRWDFDSGCAGIVIVSREAWHQAKPRTTYAKRYVYDVLEELIAERVTHILNGWIYEATLVDEDEHPLVIGTGFLTAKEALECVLIDYPDIKYSEDDFDVHADYCLKAA